MNKEKIEHDGCTGCKHFKSFKDTVTDKMPCYECRLAHKSKELEDKYVPMSNGDYIRNMSDEELAKAIARNNTCTRCDIREYCHDNIKNRNCVDVALDWLKAEREDRDVKQENEC